MLAKIKSFLKSQTFIVFLIFLAISFAAYVGYLNQTYIGDNYGGRVNGFDQMSFGEYFNSDIITTQGRHMSITYWLLHAPLSKLGITYFQNQWVFFAIEIIVMAIASTIFYSVFAKALKQKKISIPLIFAISFIAVNPFICDALIYLLPSHPQALLFVAISLYFLAKEHKLKNVLLSLLFLTLAISTYQNYYALYVILALPLIFILNKGKVDKTLFKRAGLVLLSMILSIGIVLLVSKLHCAILGISSAKSTSIHLSISWLVSRTIFLLKTYIKSALTTFYLFPPLLIVAIVAAAGIALAIHLIRNHKYKEFAFLAVATIFGFFSPIYYGIIADSFYIAPRITPALFASLSISIITLMYFFPKLQKNNYFVGGTMALLAIVIYCCSTFITDVQIANRVELAELRLIVRKIEDYEAENNTEIKTIVVHHRGGAKGEFYRQNINMIAADNASRDIAPTEWSDVGSITTLSGRQFERKDISDKEYKKYFANLELSDYAVFDPDKRLVFVGDTLYWAEY